MVINNKEDLMMFLIENNFLIIGEKGKEYEDHIYKRKRDNFAFIIKEVKI